MKRLAALSYGVFCYLMFLGVFLYAIGFVGDFAVPKSLDSSPQTVWPFAVLVNLALLGVFALQHSGMARPTFKRWLTKIVPEPFERATYVLFSNLAMILLFWFWQPLGGQIWQVENSAVAIIIYMMYAAGWATVLYTTCLLNHFELFGLRQVWLFFQRKPYQPLPFGEPSLYRHVRHPLYVGWLMVMWFTPSMTISHLFFAVGCTGYILIAIQLEERNLVDDLPGYAEYRTRVPMLIPVFRSDLSSSLRSTSQTRRQHAP